MTREKRLGRGLEALLGRIPASTEPQATTGSSTHHSREGSAEEPYGSRSEEPYGVPLSWYDPPQVKTLVGQSGQSLAASAEAPLGRPGPADGPIGAEPAPDNGPQRIDIRRIESNPYQPRQDFDEAEMAALAESLLTHGLLQPIVVRRLNDRYQVVAGERRLRAAGRAGWSEVPVQVVEADDRQVAELAIVENLQRKDLNPLEKATSFQRYLQQYGCTQEELAARLKLDRSTIANLIRLLELPEKVQEAIRQGKITQGHARALLPLGDEREQVAFCQRIQREGLNVRQTEAIVQQVIKQADAEPLTLIGRDGQKSRAPRVQSEHVAALEQQFRAALGTKVAIRHNSRGRGKLVIHFRSHEEFERVRQHICGPCSSQAQTSAG